LRMMNPAHEEPRKKKSIAAIPLDAKFVTRGASS
jgi:hypothetical protein